MGSQKGFTLIEAIFTVACIVLFVLAATGACYLFGWIGPCEDCGVSETVPVAQAAYPAPTTTAPAISVETEHVVGRAPVYQKVVEPQIVAVECDFEDCNAALVAFERAYRDCNVIPIGPFDHKGYTTHYYFLVQSAQ